MSTTVITTRVDSQIKREAMDTAEELGIPLSVVVKAFLKQFIRTKTVSFTAGVTEIPNAETFKVLQQAEKNLQGGPHSPVFKTGEEAVNWLEKQGI